VALEGIGRVRARALYDAGLTDPRKILQVSNSKLSAISKIGPTVAAKLKEQLKKTEQEKSFRRKNEIDR
ncbi:MAG TPA: helix-hairpin-helix domain-containing protein, partial [Nitrososphaeraceae archaeon]|nr:helix-hairpin-helix domain-containing protein [Nitrososphaeraceae archaeon]